MHALHNQHVDLLLATLCRSVIAALHAVPVYQIVDKHAVHAMPVCSTVDEHASYAVPV